MRSVQACGLSLLVVGLSMQGALAQSFPSKPVHILIGGSGGSSDNMARLIGPDLGSLLGQPVVIENRPAGYVVVGAVTKAPPDGYTLMINGSPVWIAPLFSKAPYDTLRDLAPIGMLTQAPVLVVVHPSLPVKNVADLIALVRAKPGELNYSSGSDGGSAHVSAELFKSQARVDIVRVPYKDGAQESNDLLSGRVQMTFSASVSAFVKSGKLRAIATGGSKRSALFPDLPTVAETVPGYQTGNLNAFFAPANTPEAIIRRLNQDAQRVLDKPEIRDKLLAAGTEVAGGAPELLTNYIKSDVANISKMLKDSGATPGS